MAAIPEQLARALPAGTIRLGTRVREVGHGVVRLDDGERVAVAATVVAADGDAASALVDGCSKPRAGWNGTTTLYFAAESPPIQEAILQLNGTGEGPIHHVCVPSHVQAGYAPSGQALVSVSVLSGTR